MQQHQNFSDSKFLYGLLPALPVILAALLINLQNGFTLYVVLVSLVLVVCGIGIGLFLWQRHLHDLDKLNSRWNEDERNKINTVATYTTELERLLLTISPVLSQHVMVSREHTEQEIIALTSCFASMLNELQQIVDSTDNTLDGQNFHLDSVLNTSRNLLEPVLELLRQIHQTDQSVVDDSAHNMAETNIRLTLENLGLALTHYRDHVVALRNNAEQIRNEINNVLLGLQFQDRVSQILTQVENNLLNMQKTIQTIQQQGSSRDRDMLQVDLDLENIKENYKTVNSRLEREPDGSDDLTFF